jgi:hypothetical protein
MKTDFYQIGFNFRWKKNSYLRVHLAIMIPIIGMYNNFSNIISHLKKFLTLTRPFSLFPISEENFDST